MKISVTWDMQHQVALLRMEDVVLDDARSVREFLRIIVSQFVPLARKGPHGKVPLVICTDNMTIRPSAANLYGEAAKEILSHASGWARYGEPRMVQVTIAVEALKQGYKANLFDNQRDAIHHALGEAAKSR